MTRILMGFALLGSIPLCHCRSAHSPGATPIVGVSGTWDAAIAGTQQRSGDSQTDEAVLELVQSASSVSGAMTYSGLSEGAALTGTVSGSTFTFTASQLLGPNCAATVQVTATLSEGKNKMSGPYNVETCEDTVVGTLTAVRR